MSRNKDIVVESFALVGSLFRAGVEALKIHIDRNAELRSEQVLRDALAKKTTLNERQIEEVVKAYSPRDRARLLVDLHRRPDGVTERDDREVPAFPEVRDAVSAEDAFKY